jgi:predicted DNA-binding transcriptional regulator AlpA
MSVLLTTKEVALKLKINPMTVNRSRNTGVLLGHPAPSFISLGRSIRYKENVINAWIIKLEEGK